MRSTIRRLLAPLVGVSVLGRAYRRAASGDPAQPFPRRALEVLDVSLAISAGSLEGIPRAGPAVVVANHPFGAVDGLALLDLVGRRRRDVKMLANHWLTALAGLREHVIAVDAFGGRGARARNVAALRRASEWLRGGGCLCVFPAGEVAHEEVGGRVVDSPWRLTAAELAMRAQAVTVPVWFDGQNSRLFRAAGRVHPLLRTLLLPREMWARRGSTVHARVGDAVAPTRLSELPSPAARTQHLRQSVEALATADAALPPVATRGGAAAIAADVSALGAQALVESGAFAVYCAAAEALPHVLPEIGRLRELTFRAAGEGTGRERDLDAFDETYLHLFVWNRDRQEIAGAYRIRSTAQLGDPGASGLYTRKLFHFGDDLLHQMGPALELGRSFVAPDYQRDYSPLLLLWKGIGRFVARHPMHRRLFGAVSISDRYTTTTRSLMAAFLSVNRRDARLAPLVRPRHPVPPPTGEALSALAGLEGRGAMNDSGLVDAVRQLERDGKDVPVLLRQYLRLNAKLLSFSVDPSFGNVLDGLLVVDLMDVDPSLLARYMGRDELARFRALHAAGTPHARAS
jgi:putative hemolysin